MELYNPWTTRSTFDYHGQSHYHCSRLKDFLAPSHLYPFFIPLPLFHIFFLRVAYVVLCSSCLSHTPFPVSIDIIASLVFHSAIQETQAFWQAFFFPFFLIVFPRLAWHVPQQFVYNFILKAVIYFKGILNYLKNQYIFSHFLLDIKGWPYWDPGPNMTVNS